MAAPSVTLISGTPKSSSNGGRAKVMFTANGYLVPCGNSTTSNVNATNTCIAAAGEVVGSSNILSAKFGTANGAYWTVSRGANAYLTLSGFGEFNEPLTFENTANVVVTLTGAPQQGFLILTISK